eukprot:355622-Prymnesium_polylepis.1
MKLKYGDSQPVTAQLYRLHERLWFCAGPVARSESLSYTPVCRIRPTIQLRLRNARFFSTILAKQPTSPVTTEG